MLLQLENQGTTFFTLREHIPLQQGLRHLLFYPHTLFPLSQRAYSTTTRIKTKELASYVVKKLLREHIPLQQGLRHNKV